MNDPRPELRSRAAAERAARNGVGEARVLAELATAETALGALPEAIAALERAAQLFSLAGRTADESKARYGLSMLAWKQRPGSTLALKHLEDAEALARRAGDLTLLARVLDRKAGMAIAAQAYPEAARLLNDVAALRESIGDADGRLDAIRRMATVASLMGEPKRAFELLSEGLVDAAAGAGEILRARLELNLLARSARSAQTGELDPRFAGVRAEPLSVLLTDAVATGDRGGAGYVRVQMAADANLATRHEEAAAYAESARLDALELMDPMLYLLACLSIAEAREKLGDRIGVLTALFTCKASLQDLLGEAAGKPVLGVVESLERRWGQTVFDEALAGYRERVAAGPVG